MSRGATTLKRVPGGGPRGASKVSGVDPTSVSNSVEIGRDDQYICQSKEVVFG